MVKFKLDELPGTFIGEGQTRREVKLFSSPNSDIATEHFALGMTIIEPGQEHEVHEHELNSEVQVIYAGAGVMRTRDGEIPVEKGDVIGLATEEPHGFANTGAEALKILWVYYPPGLAEEKFLIRKGGGES
ncbi:cupin domain-containing protein [Bacilliculturomica massiliensis]|uniref:cupin domain-containing protein n=1 Tax=Bacilliculturomica massiliensis TaxID=1917867 RepID=UPI00102F51BB|nr:cupin domain-containing protein [Bacilliculturomica massiliensis]